jgi:hypothetical protein
MDFSSAKLPKLSCDPGRENERRLKIATFKNKCGVGAKAAAPARGAVRKIGGHGAKPDGNPVMMMPREDYNWLTDEDMAALVDRHRAL